VSEARTTRKMTRRMTMRMKTQMRMRVKIRRRLMTRMLETPMLWLLRKIMKNTRDMMITKVKTVQMTVSLHLWKPSVALVVVAVVVEVLAEFVGVERARAGTTVHRNP
jgi:hypothetical protein